jgi:hypothetical protein
VSPHPFRRCARTVSDHEMILSTATHAVLVKLPEIGFAVVDVSAAFTQVGLGQAEEARKFLLPLASQRAKDAVNRTGNRLSRTGRRGEESDDAGESEDNEDDNDDDDVEEKEYEVVDESGGGSTGHRETRK